MADLTAIILTKNEEKNIEKCILSIKDVAKQIVVVDSYSTDETVEKAKKLGAEVIQHEFIDQAKQFIYAMETICIKTKWVLRIDADERLTKESAAELEQLLTENENTDINGIIVRFEVNFMGKRLHHGGIYPFRKLLVFRYGKAHMEDRHMDEHIVLDEGRAIEMRHDSEHHDFKDLTYFIDKHNKYASREMLDYFEQKRKNNNNDEQNLDFRARIKRKIKYRVYYKLPIGLRAHLYYWYRYYFKLGFLDGKEGKIFAFMQAYWYRYLVDAKIYEREKA